VAVSTTASSRACLPMDTTSPDRGRPPSPRGDRRRP
jgi:hypothetical protein